MFTLFLPGCSGSFTSSEIKLIQDGQGIMRVLKITSPVDSLFLRTKVRSLKENDLKGKVFQKLKERMLATVNDPADPGVGIAAPQVGIGKAVIAVQRFDKPGAPFEFYINPVIEHFSADISPGPEGCLSVPALTDTVYRSDKIILSYLPDLKNREGKSQKEGLKRCTEQVKGFTAVIFQHEIDHLNGILFIDRVKH